jgi:hypothetical protein
MQLKLNATSGSALQWNNVSACSYKLFSQECVGNDGGEGKEEKRREEGKMVIRKKARGLFDRFMQRLLNGRLFLI